VVCTHCWTSHRRTEGLLRSSVVRRIWSICAFDQMRCASGKCAFDQSPNHDSNPNTNPNTNHNPNPTLNLTSTKCRACMQVSYVRTFDQTRCAFGQMRNLPNAPYMISAYKYTTDQPTEIIKHSILSLTVTRKSSKFNNIASGE